MLHHPGLSQSAFSDEPTLGTQARLLVSSWSFVHLAAMARCLVFVGWVECLRSGLGSTGCGENHRVFISSTTAGSKLFQGSLRGTFSVRPPTARWRGAFPCSQADGQLTCKAPHRVGRVLASTAGDGVLNTPPFRFTEQATCEHRTTRNSAPKEPWACHCDGPSSNPTAEDCPA